MTHVVFALASLLLLAEAAPPCAPPLVFRPTSVQVPRQAVVVDAAPFNARHDWPGCSTDESSTDCAFADVDAARLRVLHDEVTSRRGAPVQVVDGGVCVSPAMKSPVVRWAAGSLPLNDFFPWRHAFEPAPRPRSHTAVAVALTNVTVEARLADGGVGEDVRALLLPSGALVQTVGGRFEGVVLGPIERVSALTLGEPRPVVAQTVDDAGTRFVIDVSPEPLVRVRVKGGVAKVVTVHGWSDKAASYDGEASTSREVPVVNGVAVLKHLKPNVESAPRAYVVVASSEGRLGAAVVTTEKSEHELTLSAPAVLILRVFDRGAPVALERVAFFEIDADVDAPENVDEAGGHCSYGGGVVWGEQRLNNQHKVTVRAPPRTVPLPAHRRTER